MCVCRYSAEEELVETPFESYDLYRGQVLGAIGGGSTLKKVEAAVVLVLICVVSKIPRGKLWSLLVGIRASEPNRAFAQAFSRFFRAGPRSES